MLSSNAGELISSFRATCRTTQFSAELLAQVLAERSSQEKHAGAPSNFVILQRRAEGAFRAVNVPTSKSPLVQIDLMLMY